MSLKRFFVLLVVYYIAVRANYGSNDWLSYAKTMSREAIAVDGPTIIEDDSIAWIADRDPQDANYVVCFEGTTQPVVYNGRVYAYAKYFEFINGYREQTGSQIIAYHADTGNILWATKIAAAAYDSWSTPCIDTKHNTVLIGSGSIDEEGYIATGRVYAINAITGAIIWTTQLFGPVVNASICIAVDIPNARAFITDYGPTMGTSLLYCIDLDANGQILWTQNIGYASGCTPAYRDGVLYIATLGGNWQNYSGKIIAFDVTGTSPVELWTTTNPDNEGFWGGVVITKEGFLYAATYDFNFEGGDNWDDNASLLKINCSNGNIVWIAQCVRTDIVPVVVGNRIYIGGTSFTRNKIEAFYDSGSSVTKLWETPEDMYIGGWSNQMVYANNKLYVGGQSSYALYEYDEIYVLNSVVTPSDPDFIIAYYNDRACGDSRAVTYDSLYAIGIDGLIKFKQPAFLSDINNDAMVNNYDLADMANNWLCENAIGTTRADLNLDGKVNFFDFIMLANEWYGELD